MKLLSRFLTPKALSVPFIPLGVDLAVGLEILMGTGAEVIEQREKEHTFKVQLGETSMAIYTDGQHVKSVWYDDPLGRATNRGRNRKVELHLARYGPLAQWTVWNENGWMKYWKNQASSARMVYGIHMDVIRFNMHE